MKSTGIVRCLDDLGRVVIPIETRRAMHIENRDPIEIFVSDNQIILKKFTPSCIFCGCDKELMEFKEMTVCKKCARSLGKECEKK